MAAAMDLTSLEKDPRLFLYTSLTAGSSHIITATSRMETILKANKIPFQAIDIATDEKARRLWQRRAGKRKIPGLVKEGYVLGDLTEVEEWNEFGELRENIGPVPANNNAPPGGLVGVQTAPPLNHNVSVPGIATTKAGSASKPAPPAAAAGRAQGIALPGAAEIAARGKKMATAKAATSSASTTPLEAVKVETRADKVEEPKGDAGKAKEVAASNPAIEHLSAPASRLQSGTATPVTTEATVKEEASEEPTAEKHRGSEVVAAALEEVKKIEDDIKIKESVGEAETQTKDATVADAAAGVDKFKIDDESSAGKSVETASQKEPAIEQAATDKDDMAEDQSSSQDKSLTAVKSFSEEKSSSEEKSGSDEKVVNGEKPAEVEKAAQE